MSYEPPEDPLKSVAKGATEAVLEYNENKIKSWIKKFKDKSIAFVEDFETIELVKKQRKKGEWELFKTYIKDKDLRILFQMGLTLRDLEKKNKDFSSLKEKIRNKHKKNGLNIAHFVQNRLFNKYMGNILDKGLTAKEIGSEIENLFENIDNTVVFIKQYDKLNQKSGEVITKMQAHSPDTFIISSVGSAIDICEKVKEDVMKKVSPEYTSEEYLAEAENKKIYFLNKVEED